MFTTVIMRLMKRKCENEKLYDLLKTFKLFSTCWRLEICFVSEFLQNHCN